MWRLRVLEWKIKWINEIWVYKRSTHAYHDCSWATAILLMYNGCCVVKTHGALALSHYLIHTLFFPLRNFKMTSDNKKLYLYNTVSLHHFNIILKNIVVSQKLLRQPTLFFFFSFSLKMLAKRHVSMSSHTYKVPVKPHMLHCPKLMYLSYEHTHEGKSEIIFLEFKNMLLFWDHRFVATSMFYVALSLWVQYI